MIMCRKTLCVAFALGSGLAVTLPAQIPAAPIQSSEPAPGTPAYDVAWIDRGNWATVSSLIADAGPVAAIPILEERFPKASDPEMKAEIASELWKIGDRKPIYADYLIDLANVAVESPSPWKLDGKEAKPQLAPEFISWANGHGFANASVAAIQILPRHLLLAAEIGDWRAEAIFRRGIFSPSVLIVTMSSMGLAKLQDTDAIPLLIQVCQSRSEVAPIIAFESLIYFDDPRAESAARKYLPPIWLKLFGDAKAYAGKDPFNSEFPDTQAQTVP